MFVYSLWKVFFLVLQMMLFYGGHYRRSDTVTVSSEGGLGCYREHAARNSTLLSAAGGREGGGRRYGGGERKGKGRGVEKT